MSLSKEYQPCRVKTQILLRRHVVVFNRRPERCL